MVCVGVRYAEGVGDMWGGEQVPPESDMEFDIELLQVTTHFGSIHRTKQTKGRLIHMIMCSESHWKLAC
jgi:hypothetical protein